MKRPPLRGRRPSAGPKAQINVPWESCDRPRVVMEATYTGRAFTRLYPLDHAVTRVRGFIDLQQNYKTSFYLDHVVRVVVTNARTVVRLEMATRDPVSILPPPPDVPMSWGASGILEPRARLYVHGTMAEVNGFVRYTKLSSRPAGIDEARVDPKVHFSLELGGEVVDRRVLQVHLLTKGFSPRVLSERRVVTSGGLLPFRVDYPYQLSGKLTCDKCRFEDGSFSAQKEMVFTSTARGCNDLLRR